MMEFGKKTYIMGILNVTPDSFSDGGEFTNVDNAIKHALEMVEQGADIIDIGAESTRPGFIEVDADTEIKRLIPVIEALKIKTNALISVDTYKSEVARKAMQSGADIINDVWGFQKDTKMAEVAAEFNCPAVVMHNQTGTEYSIEIMQSIKDFFETTIEIALKAGMKRNQLILDPGIGFGKIPEQNMYVMKRLEELKCFGLPILLGTSRKSMLGKILDLPPKERVEGTIATTVMGIIQGVDIVRVHDVKENLRAAMVTDAIYRKENQ
ncbi:dihydropteroate synthase [Acetoanaerobium noterae]|uniref:dihydropteroate synthase n=1 Tax=Acetoanaerobium noterae TaxID=745369 RepID=UPI0028AA19DC|nr:dihydropteroate synthase [Acetoanaerobium noterae]